MSGVAIDEVEVHLAALDLGREIVGTDEVGAGLTGGVGGLAGGEHGDAHVLAGARRERDRAAHHLVGLARVDAETEHDVEVLVELRGGSRLGESDGLDGE